MKSSIINTILTLATLTSCTSSSDSQEKETQNQVGKEEHSLVDNAHASTRETEAQRPVKDSKTQTYDEVTQRILDGLRGPWNDLGLTAEQFNQGAQEAAVDKYLPGTYFEVKDEKGNLIQNIRIDLRGLGPGPRPEELEARINGDITQCYNQSFTTQDFEKYGLEGIFPIKEGYLYPGAMKFVNIEDEGVIWFTYRNLNEEVLIRGRPRDRSLTPPEEYADRRYTTTSNPATIRLRKGVKYELSLSEEPEPTRGLSSMDQRRDIPDNYIDFPSTTVHGGAECKVLVTLPRKNSDKKTFVSTWPCN